MILCPNMFFLKCVVVVILHQALFQSCLAVGIFGRPSNNVPKLARIANCYSRRSPAPPITAVTDCSLAVREMIAEGSHAADPVVWGPGIDRRIGWGWGSCQLIILPNSIQSFDTISRLKLAEEATRLVSTCVTQAYGFKGGYTKVGPKGVFHLAVNGRPTQLDNGRAEE